MNCPNIAITSVANSFVAFKTPLDDKYNNKIAIVKRFNPQMVFRHMWSYQVFDNIKLYYSKLLLNNSFLISNRNNMFKF